MNLYHRCFSCCSKAKEDGGHGQLQDFTESPQGRKGASVLEVRGTDHDWSHCYGNPHTVGTCERFKNVLSTHSEIQVVWVSCFYKDESSSLSLKMMSSTNQDSSWHTALLHLILVARGWILLWVELASAEEGSIFNRTVSKKLRLSLLLPGTWYNSGLQMFARPEISNLSLSGV